MKSDQILSGLNDAGFIYLYAFLYALLEIEMEGKEGWAKNLPTPVFLGEFTLYHVLMNIIVVITILKVYFHQLADTANSIFFIAAWFLIEDFMWFVYNPHFTLKKYTKKDIWWHARQPWLLGIPIHNWIGLIVMGLSYYFSEHKQFLLSSFMWMSILSIIGIIIAPLYHKFYKNTHKNVKGCQKWNK